MKLTIVFENSAVEKLKTGWGLAVAVETGREMLLFDTGCSGRDLLQNLRSLDFNPEILKKVVISHSHWDHTGGIFDLVEINPGMHFYTGRTFGRQFADEIEQRGGIVNRGDNWRELNENIYITPEVMKNVPEQALVILRDNVSILLLGCAHPGVDRFVSLVFRRFELPLVIIGGFHYFPLSRREMIKQVKRLRKYPVSMMMPLHCSGQEGVSFLKEFFKVRELRTGDAIELDHLII